MVVSGCSPRSPVVVVLFHSLGIYSDIMLLGIGFCSNRSQRCICKVGTSKVDS